MAFELSVDRGGTVVWVTSYLDLLRRCVSRRLGTSSVGYPVVPLWLACRSARVTSDDHRRPTDGLSGDDVLMVSTTQALQTSWYFGAELVVTQHGTSGRVVKPANSPGLPLLDRNEQLL